MPDVFGLPIMGIKNDISTYLSGNGRAKVNEIADAIGYSHGYTRQNAKEMMSNGKINGAKGQQIPAVIVNGNYYVITGDKSYLLDIVRRHAPKKVSKASGMSVSELQSLIMNDVADSVVGGPRPWEFWK